MLQNGRLVGFPFHFDANPDPDPAFSLIRIRILLFTLMRIWILPFNLMRIRIRFLPLTFVQFWALQCPKMAL
jgi:hypothetical protein